MVIRELNDFVKSYQILITLLSPLSIPYQSLITLINPLSTPITLLSPLSIQATPSPSTYSQDINRPRRDIKQLHDRNRRQTPRHEHLDRLLAPSPSRPLRRTQPQRHAHVALNRLLVRTRQRAQLLLEINLPISRKGILQTLPQILFFSLHALAVTNQIPLLRPHRIQNRL